MGRRFLTVAGSVAVMLCALTVAGWQWHVTRSLRSDTAHWQAQMASNQKLMNELTATIEELQARQDRLYRAHGLMWEPEQATEFLMNLGRTLPPRLRIDRIENNENRVLLTGSLLEPAEEATHSLGRYLDSLRRTPEIGGRFSSITATSLQRDGRSDSLIFEITLRRNPPPPG